jgi:hypothetical protein
MTATASTPHLGWARAHRAALAIVVLSIALVATLSVLAVRLATGAGTAPAQSPTHSVPAAPLGPIDDRCAMVGPGQPC